MSERQSYSLDIGDFERMAAVAFDVKNAMMRMGVRKPETIKEIAKAMQVEAAGATSREATQ